MINRYIPLFLMLVLSGMMVAHAADDPMKSLFLFQKQMADTGNSSAMMKLGEMYEHGDGIAQSNAKAMKMYEKAKTAGHKGADIAIKRIKNASNKSARLRLQEEKKRQEALQRKKAEAIKKNKEREALAQKKAAEKQLKLQQAAKERKAKEEAAREKAAEEMAKKRQLEKLKADKKKAAAEKTAADEAKAKRIRMLAEQKRRKEQLPTAPKKKSISGFKADPCKSPAARLMSICKNK